MDRERLFQWIDRVYATGETEIDCNRLQALLPEYVEFQAASGGDAELAEKLAGVQAHLAQCPDCAEEYAGLLAVVKAARAGELPTPEASLEKFAEPGEFEQAERHRPAEVG